MFTKINETLLDEYSKPNENMFFDYKKLEESTEFVAPGAFNLYSSIGETSSFFDKNGGSFKY